MSTINKPSFPSPSTHQVERKLDQLQDAVRVARRADGSVDVEQLEQAARGDAALELGVEAIKDDFQRNEVRVYSSCGRSRVHEAWVDPEKLEAAEVQSVMSALMEAKAKVRELDGDRDGKISRAEAAGARRPSGLSGELAEAALDGALQGYRAELEAWREALADVASTVRGRRRFDQLLREAASHHAESATGADAILWAYRDLATRGSDIDIWTIRGKLEDAETTWLRFIPLFGRSATYRRGHLDDREVRELLGCDDLAAFARDRRAAIEARVGGDYAASWLAGRDLPGLDQLGDPDAGPRADPDAAA